MKKGLMIALVSIGFAGTSMAGTTVKENCGCGLGGLLLGEQESLLAHCAATILNGVCGNQTFGITSGTLGCDQPANLVYNKDVNEYIDQNMDVIAFEIAAGNGQSLSALADLMQVPVAQREGTFAKWQSGFDGIFSHEDITAEEVATKLAQLI